MRIGRSVMMRNYISCRQMQRDMERMRGEGWTVKAQCGQFNSGKTSLVWRKRVTVTYGRGGV